MLPKRAEFRFYSELNDFLEPSRRRGWLPYRFSEAPGIKDPIEALGVPHTEVALIVVNGFSVGFDYQLQQGDRVTVYPKFFQVDIEPLTRLREPLETPVFVLDVHLGKLARLLRLLGIDVLYRNDYRDAELVDIAEREGRAVLTRDRCLLFHRRIVYGRFVRSTDPMEQVKEVIRHFGPELRLAPFSRCMSCNGPVVPVKKEDVRQQLLPKTARYYDKFCCCRQCGKIYWKGPHFEGLSKRVREFRLQQQ